LTTSIGGSRRSHLKFASSFEQKRKGDGGTNPWLKASADNSSAGAVIGALKPALGGSAKLNKTKERIEKRYVSGASAEGWCQPISHEKEPEGTLCVQERLHPRCRFMTRGKSQFRGPTRDLGSASAARLGVHNTDSPNPCRLRPDRKSKRKSCLEATG